MQNFGPLKDRNLSLQFTLFSKSFGIGNLMVERVDICTHLAPKNDSNINVFQALFSKGKVFLHGGKMYAFSPLKMRLNGFLEI